MKKIFNFLSKLSLLVYCVSLFAFIFFSLLFCVVYLQNFYSEKYLHQVAKSAVFYLGTDDFKENFKLTLDKQNNLFNENYKDQISAKISRLCKLHSDKIEFALFAVDTAIGMTKRIVASKQYNFDNANFSKILGPLLTGNTFFYREKNFLNRSLYCFKTILDDTGEISGILSLYIPDTELGQLNPVLVRLVFLSLTAFFVMFLIAAIYLIRQKPDEDTMLISHDIKREVDVIENSLNQVIDEFEKKNNEFYQLVNQLVLSEKMSVKIVMASGISHELKNYLVPLQGYVILLQKIVNSLDDKELKQKSEKYFSIINSQVVKLDWLAKSLSLISRPSDLDYKPVNLNNLIIDSVKLVYSVIAKYSGYELVMDETSAGGGASEHKLRVITCQDAPEINGDVYSLSQLVVALLINSLNAMSSKSSGEITMGFKRLDESGEFGFYVKDTGPGIGNEIKEFAFEPFMTTIDKKGFGTGMGFVKIVASRHDARIEFESDLNLGTEVVIWFPPEEQIP